MSKAKKGAHPAPTFKQEETLNPRYDFRIAEVITLAEASFLTGVQSTTILLNLRKKRISARRTLTGSGVLLVAADVFRAYPIREDRKEFLTCLG